LNDLGKANNGLIILLAGNTVSFRRQPFVKTLKQLCPVHFHTIFFPKRFPCQNFMLLRSSVTRSPTGNILGTTYLKPYCTV